MFVFNDLAVHEYKILIHTRAHRENDASHVHILRFNVKSNNVHAYVIPTHTRAHREAGIGFT